MKYFLAIIIMIFTTTLITQGQVTDSAKQRQAQTDSVTHSMNNEDAEDVLPLVCYYSHWYLLASLRAQLPSALL